MVVQYDPSQSLEYKKEYGKLGWAKYMDDMYGTNLYEITTEWDAKRKEANTEEPEVPVKIVPVTEYNAAQEISEQVGEVEVPVHLVVSGVGGSAYGGGVSGGGGLADYYWETTWGGFKPGFANGLPMTPFDGWYFLHKNETVTPAREVSNRSYNSNLYVENMHMGNGMDAQAVATALSAQNRRISAGFGS